MLKRIGITAALVIATAIAPFAVNSAGASGATSDSPPAGAVIVYNGSYTGLPALPSSCSSPNYTSIQDALNAATSNETIYVCAGTYDENVNINTNVTLLGAQYETDAVGRSGAPETVIDSPNGVTYETGATTGSLEGFTLNAATDSTGEIYAAGTGSGWNFTNNIINVNKGGIYFNTDGVTNPASTVIAGNAFVQTVPASEYGGGYEGQAIALWGQTGNNVQIEGNAFINLSGPGAAINTTGAGAGPGCDGVSEGLSQNLLVAHNTFQDNGGSGTDENFIALFCSENASISGNNLTITDSNDANAESPIYLGGGNVSASVTGNVETGNGAPNAAGVEVNTAFYPTDNATVSGNSISGFNWGVLVYGGYGTNFSDSGADSFAAPTGFTIENNSLSDDAVGVQVLDDGSTYNGVENLPTGGLIINNTITGSSQDACVDASTGSGTDGTGNTWTTNTGTTNSPANLCGANSISASTPPSNAYVGGSTYSPSATSTFGTPTITLDGTSTGCALNAGVVSFTSQGECVIDFNVAGTANYDSASLQQSITVSKGTNVITPSTPPANPVVGGATYTPSGTALGGTVSVSLSGDSGICTLNTGVVSFVGTGNCVIDFATTGNANYGPASTSQTLVVGKASQSVTFGTTAPSNAYVGGPTYSASATATSHLAVTFSSSSPSVCTVTTSGVVSFVGSGTCTVTATQVGNAQYSLAATSQSFSVSAPKAPSFSSDASSGVAYWLRSFSTTLSATGVPTPTVTAVTFLPLGVTATSGPNGTVTLSGTPLLPGIYPIEFKATSSAGTTYFWYTLVIGL
ncbi:MAG: hypothetical protein WAN30_03395 [Acidimicrobiales bacterium]